MKRFVVFFLYFFIAKIYTIPWTTENVSVGLLSNQVNQIFYRTVANDVVSELKNNGVMPPDFNLSIHVHEGCDDDTAMKGAVKFWKDNNINVLFGPECSTGLNVVALFASNINVPVFSYTPMPSDLENKTKFSTLVHMAFDYSQTYQAIYAVLKYYNWTRIGIVKTSSYCAAVMGAATLFLAQKQIQYADVTIDLTKNDSVVLILNILNNVTRVNLVCTGTGPKDALPFLNFADKMGMLNSDYVYILPVFQKDNFETWDNLILDPSLNEESRQLIKKLYKYTLIVQIDDGNISQIQNFNKSLNTVSTDFSQRANMSLKSLASADLKKLAVFRDAIYLYGLALNKTYSTDYSFGGNKSFIDACANSQFTGISGEVIINDKIERLPEYIVFQLASETWTPILRLGSNSKFNSSYEIQVIATLKEPQWHTLNNSVPKAFPLCGFGTAKCPDNNLTGPENNVTIVTVVVLAVILFCVSLISGIYFYRKRLFEQRVYQMTWKVDLKNLRLVSKGEYLKSSIKSEKDVSATQFSLINSFASFIQEGKFELSGFYNNKMVAVKRWKKISALNLNRDHLLLLKALKDLNHENLNPFIGLVVDDGPAVIAIWAQCAKGSLNDIIFNDDIQLDIMFKVSILRDIITGLDYLHSSTVGFHGKLHLSNCLVDSKWVIKLTDFGLEPLVEYMRQNNIIRPTEISFSNDNLLMVAPEVLRNVNATNKKAADIYSFGMIAYQVLYRSCPYDSLKMHTNDIVAQIKRGGWAPPRPSLKPLKGCSSNLLYIINLCWHEIPLRRPTAATAKQEIFRSTKIFGKNLMDHVMSMLSKYATNLERIVVERTEKLNDERKRYDTLLYQMLPKSIADALTAGQNVDPETFDCATICFYNIVGFNSLCLLSTPNQLITTLTNLCSQIDYLISSFNSYKVETIGDTQCVVSGLPVKNGNDHVCNIANLSLKIFQLVDTFVVHHQPSYKLFPRIGFHSGPVACGVVGLTIPRFCLFGETVNFASRMEKSSEVGKIQISESSKILLDSFSIYDIIRRRLDDVNPNTYWLVARN